MSLPDPLVPSEVDLQDFPFMPLQVARLRDSDLAAEEEPETCWYAVLLWAASWHQIPAGSLPDNDTVLMRLVGLGRDKRTWNKHRKGALRGFVLCSDGRLYHKTVAEQAIESWTGKLRQRHRTFCAAVRQHNARNPENKLQSPSFDEWEALGRPASVAENVTDLSRVQEDNVTRDKGSKGQGQGQGQGHPSNTLEPDGSNAADAASAEKSPQAIDAVKIIFDTGVRQLAVSGKRDAEARSIIGRWRKQFGDSIVLAVLPRCEVERPSDPLEWISKALQAEARKAAGNGYGNSDRQGRGGSTRSAAQLALERLHQG
ncbi:DUF1376 domain-containing protein [Croceibacterium aestuarii]|uniref:DUF1376 domain-containing protein n=1 Tax=Croceibacterium aestuarii TaxID=3064139 RepID=UPI00272E46C4|nr:DUF1376 domain-containing protein [Croceibacterium sp. D39]